MASRAHSDRRARPGVTPAGRPLPGYQTFARCSPGRAIAQPSGTPNASANADAFDRGPFTRNRDATFRRSRRGPSRMSCRPRS
jgi:hypothetical protein